MVRPIIIVLLLSLNLFAQTTNKNVYEQNLDSLSRVSPFKDSIEVTIAQYLVAHPATADTTHLVAFGNVIGLQDTVNKFVAYADSATTIGWYRRGMVDALLNAKANALGSDDNYVTDAEKTKLSNLSGTNTGDQDLSELATKFTFYEHTSFEEGYDITPPVYQNIFININNEDPANISFNFNSTLTEYAEIRIKLINVNSGTITMNFGNELNYNPVTSSGESNIELTSSDLGWSRTFIYNGSYWYTID